MDEKWQQSIDGLRQKRETLSQGGGPERIAKQHASGKLTARERLEALFDNGVFFEMNDMITSRATDFGMAPGAATGKSTMPDGGAASTSASVCRRSGRIASIFRS